MSTYKIGVDNTFTVPNSPVKIEMGEYSEVAGYKSIKALGSSEIMVKCLDQFSYNVSPNTVQCGTVGSYSFLITDKTKLTINPQLFSFYVYPFPNALGKDWLLQLINGELPTIYNPNEILNAADNAGIAAVMNQLYLQLVDLYYGTITSIGTGSSYSQDWEYVYIGVNNFLQNCVYPAQFLKTMMRIPAQTGISMIDLSIFTSNLAFQITGQPCPVEMYYNEPTNTYIINIFANNIVYGWQLGLSLLGEDTYLSTPESSPFVYILCKILGKLLPVTIKYFINILPYDIFLNEFNTAQVQANDYIDSSVRYQAYAVVNNNNLFNTKGYYRV